MIEAVLNEFLGTLILKAKKFLIVNYEEHFKINTELIGHHPRHDVLESLFRRQSIFANQKNKVSIFSIGKAKIAQLFRFDKIISLQDLL